MGSSDLYRSAQGWSYFINFIEIDNFPSAGIYGIKKNQEVYSKVYWANECLNIEVSNKADLPLPYVIYLINGKTLKQGNLEIKHTSISIPSDIYIVQVGDDIHKVVNNSRYK